MTAQLLNHAERVVFLGSASGQTKSLEPVSFVLDSSVRILVETGPSVIRQLEAAGLRPKDLDSIFVTHAHADHCLGFPYLAFNKHIDRIENEDANPQLMVFCSKQVRLGLTASTSFHYPPGKFLTFDFCFSDVDETPTGHTPGQIAFETLPVKHTVPAFALKLKTTSGKVVVYSSDTIYDESVVALARNADLLIHEAMLPTNARELSRKVLHATVDDARRVALEAAPRMVALCHMIPDFFDKEAEVIQEIKRSYSGEVIFPREGTAIAL